MFDFRVTTTSRDDFEVLEAVKSAKWEWPKHVSISRTGKAFVAGLLVVDPANRLTSEQALNHPWMQVIAMPYLYAADSVRS